MHIGFFIKNYASGKKFSKDGVPIKSGAEFHAENHAKLFVKNGDDVTVFTKKMFMFTKNREYIDGIDVCRLHGGVRWIEVIFRLLITHKSIDAFYIIGTPKFSVWAILFAKFILKKPTTLVLTGVAEIYKRDFCWRNKILSMCDNYIGGSIELVDGLNKQGLIEQEKIHLLPHGVDTVNRFYPVDGITKYQLREKYNLPKDKKIVLFCARVVLNKGVDTMIKIWEKIYEIDKKIQLIVVGGGANDLLSELSILSGRLNNSIRVFGEMDKADDFYKLSDVYLFPSRYEGISTSLMEAMASGLPIVASKIGGNIDIIKDGINGYVIDVEDVDGYVDGIMSIINSEEISRRFSKYSRDYAERYLDENILFRKLKLIISNHLQNN